VNYIFRDFLLIEVLYSWVITLKYQYLAALGMQKYRDWLHDGKFFLRKGYWFSWSKTFQHLWKLRFIPMIIRVLYWFLPWFQMGSLSLEIQFNVYNLLSTSKTPSGLSLYDYIFVFISHLSIHSSVSVRFLNADARGRYQVSPREIFGEQSGSSASFSKSSTDSPCRYHSTNVTRWYCTHLPQKPKVYNRNSLEFR